MVYANRLFQGQSLNTPILAGRGILLTFTCSKSAGIIQTLRND